MVKFIFKCYCLINLFFKIIRFILNKIYTLSIHLKYLSLAIINFNFLNLNIYFKLY